MVFSHTSVKFSSCAPIVFIAAAAWLIMLLHRESMFADVLAKPIPASMKEGSMLPLPPSDFAEGSKGP